MLTIAQETGALSPEMVATWVFYPFAALTVLSAWAIVVSQSIVRMAVYLLLTLGGVAGMYFMLNAELLAAVQLIVYVGGTLILIIFGVMLTSRNPFMQLKVRGWELTVGILIGSSIVGLVLLAIVNTTLPPQAENLPATAGGAGQGGYGQVEMVGRGLLSKYLVPFEVSAVLLLVVMIGAAFMARKRAGQE